MYKKNLIKKSKLIQYFDQKEIGSIPRIFISSLLLILFFYSMPLVINYANNKDTAFENKSKQVLNLAHPVSHDFYSASRNKLGWSAET